MKFGFKWRSEVESSDFEKVCVLVLYAMYMQCAGE